MLQQECCRGVCPLEIVEQENETLRAAGPFEEFREVLEQVPLLLLRWERRRHVRELTAQIGH